MKVKVVAKIDVGLIALDVTEDDIEKIKPFLQHNGGVVPNVKLSVYKNRRGAYNRVFLWMYADKGTCRYKTMFVTDFNYRPISICDVDVNVNKEVSKTETTEASFEPAAVEEFGDDYEF